MEKIYIVYGKTGEYDDFVEWNVCCYKDEEDAKKHSEKANIYAERAYKIFIENPWVSFLDTNPYDKGMRISQPGTEYSYCEMEIQDRFDETE